MQNGKILYIKLQSAIINHKSRHTSLSDLDAVQVHLSRSILRPSERNVPRSNKLIPFRYTRKGTCEKGVSEVTALVFAAFACAGLYEFLFNL